MGPESWRDILQASGEDVPTEGGDEEEGNKEKINKTKIVLVQWPNMAQLGQMINDRDLHHQLENMIDMPVDTANVQKENKVKDTGKKGKECENLGAQAEEIIEQVPVLHAILLIFRVLLSRDLPNIIQ